MRRSRGQECPSRFTGVGAFSAEGNSCAARQGYWVGRECLPSQIPSNSNRVRKIKEIIEIK